MSNIIRVAEKIVPAQELSITEIGINSGSAGVVFSDGSIRRIELTPEQVEQIEDIILGEVVKVDADLTVEKVVEAEPAKEIAKPE